MLKAVPRHLIASIHLVCYAGCRWSPAAAGDLLSCCTQEQIIHLQNYDAEQCSTGQFLLAAPVTAGLSRQTVPMQQASLSRSSAPSLAHIEVICGPTVQT